MGHLDRRGNRQVPPDFIPPITESHPLVKENPTTLSPARSRR